MRPICLLRPQGTKKAYRPLLGPARDYWCPHAQDRPKPLLLGLQEAYLPLVDPALPTRGAAGAFGQLGGSSQHGGGLPARPQRGAVLATLALASGYYRGRYGLYRRSHQTT